MTAKHRNPVGAFLTWAHRDGAKKYFFQLQIEKLQKLDPSSTSTPHNNQNENFRNCQVPENESKDHRKVLENAKFSKNFQVHKTA